MMKVDAEERSEKTSRLFRNVNKHFHHPLLHHYFRYVTHLGGATFTISAVLSLLIVLRDELRWTAVAAAISLTLSHLPVAIIKKFYPRRRPYIVMKNTYVPANPLQDHSFPSGQTTAIFSVIVPFLLQAPALAPFLLVIGLSIALSRIFLGLHYPSDVLVGMTLGSGTGYVSCLLVHQFFTMSFASM